MEPKEVSDLVLSRVECGVCGAVWLDGNHVWSTGRPGDTKSLSNLVCGIKDSPDCINPDHKVAHIYGEADTWEKRKNFIDRVGNDDI
tara:strand:- start:90 stop:350 length:261 start_codon:yes stop_codon:yes gene_type:complete